MKATSGGEIDVKDSEIYNVGTDPLGLINPAQPAGILVSSGIDAASKLVAGILLVDPASGFTLTLDGGGDVALTGGTITGQAANAGDTLVNSDNTISGYGLISNLTLTNDFIIEAANGTLALSNTTVTNSGAGTVTVASGATLDLEGGNINGGTFGNAGTIIVTSGDNTIQSVIVTDIEHGSQLTVSGGTLTLDHDTFSPAIGGGILTITVDSGAVLNIDNSSLLDVILINNTGGTINVSDSTVQTVKSTLTGLTTVSSGQT